MPRASLPMYNLPEMQHANAAFWQALRTELARLGITDTPDKLEFDRKPVPDAIEPDMLFTQVCGWPLHTIYAGQGVMLGVPIYNAPFCDGPIHSGVFVVHRDSPWETVADLRGCHYVFNSVHSNTGMNLPRRLIADLAGGKTFFGPIAETHSHPGNIERVARHEADATCVDCVTYAFFARHRPNLAAQTRILAPTPPSPAIPFVTAVATSPDVRAALTTALLRVARAPEWAAERDGLMLLDVVAADPKEYELLGLYDREARQRGYSELQ